MKIEVLLSTMNINSEQELQKLKTQMNIRTDIQVINQITKKEIKPLQTNCIYSYVGKGLSKSRNIAISKAKGDIAIIADDDVTYTNDYAEKINEAYIKYPDADIIVFDVDNLNKNNKNKEMKENRINWLTAMKIQSVQLTFKISSLLKNGIKFDENFGANSKYMMGEENILLYDCLKKKMKIQHVKSNIGMVKQEKSTWFNGFNDKYFISEGAIFYRISKRMYIFLILQFAIRKHSQYKDSMQFVKAIKYMLSGANEYKMREK